MIDVEKARSQTPGCTNVLHFNNAGASLMPDPVFTAVEEFQQLERIAGGYEAEELRHADIEAFYFAAADLLNCSPEEIAFVENATRAWDMAFYSMDFQPSDRILTSVAEYASNFIAFLQMSRRTGVKIEVVPNDEYGQLCVQSLERMIDDRVKLIAVTHVPTNGGLVNPAAEIGRLAKSAGITYLLDACQSVGQMPIDVQEIGCDILSCTGRKFLRGPRGTGLLFISKQVCRRLEPVFLDLHASTWIGRNQYIVREDARRFETWECNFANKLGLTSAMRYALSWGLVSIESRISALAATLREQLSEIPGVSVHDTGQKKCGIVTFTKANQTADQIERLLKRHQINVSTSTTNGTRIDMEERGLSSIVRASVHYYNTEVEIEKLCRHLASM